MRSTPTIVVHPASTPARTAASPTVPMPNTASELPAGMARLFRTAPAPVWTPQPNGAATSRGIELSILTTLRSEATACVAKLDCPKKWA